MKLKCLSFVFLLLSFYSCTLKDNETSFDIEKEYSGIWHITSGKPEKLNLLSELGLNPKSDVINQMEDVSLPIDVKDLIIEHVDNKTYIRFPLDKGEKIFGLGLNFKTVEQRGRIMKLHVDHYGGSDNGRTHAPVPFFVSSKGYGALINSARYIDVWCGTSVRKDSKNSPVVRDRNTDKKWSAQPYSDNLEFLVPADGIEIILFSGKNMLDVVRRYNLYNGGGVLPPKWGLGFWQRVPTLFSEKDVKQEVESFEKNDFPLSVVGLEPGWMSKSYPCTYEWDKGRFPNPESLIKELDDKNIKTNIWINPYISPNCEIYEKMLPYTSSHNVWCGVVPDYSMILVQNIMRDHFMKHHFSKGISGYKMDENDGYDSWLWPDVAHFPSNNSAEQIRQIYGSLMQCFTTQMYKENNKRTYGLVRSANAGTSSFPYVIYNDYYVHKDFITALINSSFIGVLWTPEVRASKNAEEWLRRMQTVCFSPLAMLNAWANGTKPWSFPEVTDKVREIAKLRMRLVPYLYTAFANYAFKGIPPVRAMNLEEGYAAESEYLQKALDGTENPYALAVKKEVKNQFMVGECLLVAPFFAGQKERQVILPRGKWFDFYTGEFVGDGCILNIKSDLDKIPVFVKDGGIVPLWPAINKIDDKKYPVEVRVYGTKSASFDLYDDDGETYNYEKGEFSWVKLNVNTDKEGERKGTVKILGDRLWSYSDFKFCYMTKE